jgi:hypothetical protein
MKRAVNKCWYIIPCVVVGVALAAFWWIVLGPGPMDFAGGTRVRIADSHGPNPTGVPAELANANLVERGQYLARAADCEACHYGARWHAVRGRSGFRPALRDALLDEYHT